LYLSSYLFCFWKLCFQQPVYFFVFMWLMTSNRQPCSMQNFAFCNMYSAFSFTPLINGYLLLILSLILHLCYTITIWMKTDKFSQGLTTQHNGPQRMQRMIKPNFCYGSKSNTTRTNGEIKDIANRKTNNLWNCVLWISHQEC
jgi:hypothetical protein